MTNCFTCDHRQWASRWLPKDDPEYCGALVIRLGSHLWLMQYNLGQLTGTILLPVSQLGEFKKRLAVAEKVDLTEMKK